MQKFLDKYSRLITGKLSCFDRVVFKGYLPLGWPGAMKGLLYREGLLIKDFGDYVHRQSQRIRAHAEAFAKQQGRPCEWFNKKDKDGEARRIAEKDGITEGLICVFRRRKRLRALRLPTARAGPTWSMPHVVACVCTSIFSIRSSD